LFLLVYPIRVGSDRVQIGSGLIWFGLFRVQVYIGSIRVQVSSGSIRIMSNFGSIQFITVSDRFGFGSVQFQISVRNRLISFSCRFRSNFGSFGSGHFCQVYERVVKQILIKLILFNVQRYYTIFITNFNYLKNK